MWKRERETIRMVQLFTLSDPGVRAAAGLHLEEEKESKKKRFRPAVLVDELLAGMQPQKCTVQYLKWQKAP